MPEGDTIHRAARTLRRALTGAVVDAAAGAAAVGVRRIVGQTVGPDGVQDGTDLVEARRRLDARAGWAVGEALLDQRVMAGVGNVYRCEVLFLEGVNPWAAVCDVPGPSRDALLATAERLLKRNAAAASARRRTTGSLGRGEELFVYGRAHRPCRRCGTPVRVSRQGARARVTYWCAACQPGPDPGARRAAPSARMDPPGRPLELG